MANFKERHLFPGGNTSQGFFSFYKYILSQEDANRIICLKGGPGTGKSSFMKKIGAYFASKNYSIEYHHCSSDNNSLDGVVIKELNVAVLDGTSPHMVDPIHPGAVDEILNLGTAFDINALAAHKKEIMDLTATISNNFSRAYRFLKSAKHIHEDWTALNNAALDNSKVDTLIDELISKIITSSKSTLGEERHLFSTAFTPDGIVSFNKSLADDVDNLYVLKGGPGLGKTTVLKAVGTALQKAGWSVEYLHDPLVPERIENIIIKELSTAIFTTNEISRIIYDNALLYDMKNYCDSTIITENKDEIDFDKIHFDILINKGLSRIHESHRLHDILETYYISAMDFSVVDKLYNETINKIEKYK